MLFQRLLLYLHTIRLGIFKSAQLSELGSKIAIQILGMKIEDVTELFAQII